MSATLSARRTQAERTRASREKIIRAATEYFARQGFQGAKMAEIARAAGLTEPGLLHHFPSKAHLLTGVLQERDRVDKERVQGILNSDGSHVLEALQALVNHNSTVPGLVQLFTILVAESLVQQHPAHEFFFSRYRRIRGDLTQKLLQAQQAGEVRVDVPAETLAVLIYAMMDGLQVQWLFEPEKVDMPATFCAFLSLLKPKN